MEEAGRTAAKFATTNWGLLDRPGDQAALGELLRAYWAPVYAYIRRGGRSSHDAADLTQAFLTDVLMGRDLAGRADRARGRFRTYLRAALDRYLIDAGRRERARQPNRTPLLELTPERMAAAVDPDLALAPAEAFEREWATAVLERTLERLEGECRRDGLEAHWRAFEGRVLAPVRGRVDLVETSALAAELGVPPERVSGMVSTVKRRLRQVFVEVVAETVNDPGEELDDEVRRLRTILGL